MGKNISGRTEEVGSHVGVQFGSLRARLRKWELERNWPNQKWRQFFMLLFWTPANALKNNLKVVAVGFYVTTLRPLQQFFSVFELDFEFFSRHFFETFYFYSPICFFGITGGLISYSTIVVIHLSALNGYGNVFSWLSQCPYSTIFFCASWTTVLASGMPGTCFHVWRKLHFNPIVIFKAIKKSPVAGKVPGPYPEPVTLDETSEFGLYISKGIY